MATKKSVPYSITSTTDGGISPSNKYVSEFDSLGRLLAVYKQDSQGNYNVLDPTSAEWTSVSVSKGSGWNGSANSAGETLLQFNQNKYESIGDWETSISIAPEYLTYHNEIKKKQDNVASIPQGEVTEGQKQTVAPNVRSPQQFASPSSVRYTSKKQSVATFAYPYDIDTTQDLLLISRYKYDRGGNVNLSIPGKGLTLGSPLGTVILPMPKASEAGGAEWGESKVDVLGVGAINIFQGMMSSFTDPTGMIASGVKGIGNFNITQAGKLGADVGGAAQILGARYASQALGALGISVSGEDLITRSTGKAVNPNAELLFRGPTLRDFGFKFTMVARNDKEAKEIRSIIQFLKSGSVPKYENQALLGSPDIFQLTYSNDQILNKFKPMALNRITVDYAPDGYWAAYEDSHPVAVIMSLEFSELYPVYDKDYTSADSSVGF